MSTNDETIIELQERIKTKRKELKPVKFVPVTNCSLDFYGTRYNIHTLTETGVVDLMVQLNSLYMSAEQLGLLEDYIISGFALGDWMADLRAKLAALRHKGELHNLNILERRLKELLSADKKTEIEIEAIAKLI